MHTGPHRKLTWPGTKTVRNIPGPATTGGCNTDMGMVFGSTTSLLTHTTNLAPGEMKFCANRVYNINFGGSNSTNGRNPNGPISGWPLRVII